MFRECSDTEPATVKYMLRRPRQIEPNDDTSVQNMPRCLPFRVWLLGDGQGQGERMARNHSFPQA